MNEGVTKAEGGCRCGALRFRIAGDPILTTACHCTGCQRMTGGAYSVTSTWPEGAFELLSGEPALGGLKGEIRHHHCANCFSWVYTRAPQIGPFVNVRTTMLDAPPSDPPFVQCYLSEALPWARFDAAHSYDKFPAMEEWPKLLEEFASARAAATEETSA